MPEWEPEQSPDTMILAFKLVINHLGLSYETPIQRRRIVNVMGELRTAGILDLGHRIYPTERGTWYSDEMQLDLDAIRARDRVGIPFNEEQEHELRQDIRNALDRFKAEHLPNIPQ